MYKAVLVSIVAFLACLGSAYAQEAPSFTANFEEPLASPDIVVTAERWRLRETPRYEGPVRSHVYHEQGYDLYERTTTLWARDGMRVEFRQLERRDRIGRAFGREHDDDTLRIVIELNPVD